MEASQVDTQNIKLKAWAQPIDRTRDVLLDSCFAGHTAQNLLGAVLGHFTDTTADDWQVYEAWNGGERRIRDIGSEFTLYLL
jgi:hypothetical protein